MSNFGFDERGKLEYPGKNLSWQSREPTNSIHMTTSAKIHPLHKNKIFWTLYPISSYQNSSLTSISTKFLLFTKACLKIVWISSVKVPDVSLSSTLSEFKLLSYGDVEEIIKSSPSKSCSLHPIPTILLKDHLCVLLPIITRIANLSLASLFPSSLKKSIITPLLKKPSLDPEVMNHFRPVSNLSFISKVIEKAVAHQLNDHLLANDLYETYQSAYKPLHSTGTALLIVQNWHLNGPRWPPCCFPTTTGPVHSFWYC